jgi:flagellar biosynthesis protein FlhF
VTAIGKPAGEPRVLGAARCFHGKTAREAIAAASASLGSDVMVLDTRDVDEEDPIAGVEVWAMAAQADAPTVADEVTVRATLIERGGDPWLVAKLIDAANAEPPGGELRDRVARVLERWLPCAPAPWQAPPVPPVGRPATSGPRYVAVVGPTGVGKTTTLVKMAARTRLSTGLELALLSLDGFRPGAAAELAAFGRVMDVATHAAADEGALAAAMAAVSGCDLVLVDTAGLADADARNAQAKLMSRLPGVEVHLVLSAATGARELAAAAARYASCQPACLVFTKLDEADGPAAILSAARTLDRPVSCLTHGQNVPDDIDEATPHNLSAWIWGTAERPGGKTGV